MKPNTAWKFCKSAFTALHSIFGYSFLNLHASYILGNIQLKLNVLLGIFQMLQQTSKVNF